VIPVNDYGVKTMTDDTRPTGATPGGDTTGLLLVHLTTPADRNAAETEAISHAYDTHVFRARRKTQGTEWLTDDFIRRVHADMFGTIWEWAGKYRQTALNIGVKPYLIQEQIKLLTEDFRYWNDTQSTMPVIEVAARLQHRITNVHPFINGNGRHARLITDIFFYSRKHSIPQWPQIHLMTQGAEIREQYITAMKRADDGDITNLVRFIEQCLTSNS